MQIKTVLGRQEFAVVDGADGSCGWKCFPFTFPSEALPHMELLRHVRQIEKQTILSQLQSLKTSKSLKLKT